MLFDAGRRSLGQIHQIGKAKLRVNANDHLPPHFHIIAPDHEALIAIETFAILRGSIGGKSGKDLMDWAKKNQARIAGEWNRVNFRFPIA